MPEATETQLKTLANPSAWKVYEALKRAVRVATVAQIAHQVRLPQSTVRNAVYRLQDARLVDEPHRRLYRVIPVEIPITLTPTWRTKLLAAQIKSLPKEVNPNTAIIRASLDLAPPEANELRRAIEALLQEFAARPKTEGALHLEVATLLTPVPRQKRHCRR